MSKSMAPPRRRLAVPADEQIGRLLAGFFASRAAPWRGADAGARGERQVEAELGIDRVGRGHRLGEGPEDGPARPQPHVEGVGGAHRACLDAIAAAGAALPSTPVSGARRVAREARPARPPERSTRCASRSQSRDADRHPSSADPGFRSSSPWSGRSCRVGPSCRPSEAARSTRVTGTPAAARSSAAWMPAIPPPR